LRRPGGSDLIRQTVFRTHEVDEAIEYYGGNYGWHSRVPVGKNPFTLSLSAWIGDSLVIGEIEQGCAQVIRATAPGSMMLLHLPIDSANHYLVGRRQLTATPNRAVLLPADQCYTVRSERGPKLAASVTTDRLVQELEERWPGRRGHFSIRSIEIPLSGPERARFDAMARRWRALAANDAGGESVTTTQRIEDEFVSFLADRIMRDAGVQPLSPRNRIRVDRLVEWIDRHLFEPLDVERLAAVSGIGPRGLTRICLAARGVTPMELVRNRRLEAVQRALKSSGGDALVSHVAFDKGFNHLGRFASAYREAFGEAPSETLERARSRA